jgi:hypothetical protein
MKRSLLIVATVAFAACAPATVAQHEFNIRAQSSDGRVEFNAREADIEAAFRRMCEGESRCDRRENYIVEINVGGNHVGLVFYHKDIGQTPAWDSPFIPAFTCGYYGDDDGVVCQDPGADEFSREP